MHSSGDARHKHLTGHGACVRSVLSSEIIDEQCIESLDTVPDKTVDKVLHLVELVLRHEHAQSAVHIAPACLAVVRLHEPVQPICIRICPHPALAAGVPLESAEDLFTLGKGFVCKFAFECRIVAEHYEVIIDSIFKHIAIEFIVETISPVSFGAVTRGSCHSVEV